MEKIDNGLNNYFGLNEQRKLNGQVYSLLLFVSGLTIKLNFNISKVAYCCCKTPSTIFTGKRKAGVSIAAPKTYYYAPINVKPKGRGDRQPTGI